MKNIDHHPRQAWLTGPGEERARNVLTTSNESSGWSRLGMKPRSKKAGRPSGDPRENLRRFLAEYIACVGQGLNQTVLAERLGVTPAAVSLRLTSLRRKGLSLPVLGASACTKLEAELIPTKVRCRDGETVPSLAGAWGSELTPGTSAEEPRRMEDGSPPDTSWVITVGQSCVALADSPIGSVAFRASRA